MTPLRSSRGLRGRPARAVGRRRHPQSDKPSLGQCIGFTRTAAGQVSAASARAPVGASPPKRRLARHRRQCRQGGLRIRGRPGAVGGESSCGYSRHATHRGSHRRGICPVVCHPGHASSLVARSRLTCCNPEQGAAPYSGSAPLTIVKRPRSEDLGRADRSGASHTDAPCVGRGAERFTDSVHFREIPPSASQFPARRCCDGLRRAPRLLNAIAFIAAPIVAAAQGPTAPTNTPRSAETFVHESWTAQHGLPVNSVNALFQSRRPSRGAYAADRPNAARTRGAPPRRGWTQQRAGGGVDPWDRGNSKVHLKNVLQEPRMKDGTEAVTTALRQGFIRLD